MAMQARGPNKVATLPRPGSGTKGPVNGTLVLHREAAVAQAANRRATGIVLGMLAIAPAALGAAAGALSGALGAAVGAAIGAALGWGVAVTAFVRAEASLLREAQARPLQGGELPRYVNVVEGLCVEADLPMPSLWIREDATPDLASLGRDQQHSFLISTTGLIQALNLVELEAVVAHELAHLLALDTRPRTLLSALPAAVRPLAARVLVAHPDDSEAAADLQACLLTRYPPALESALSRVQVGGGVASTGMPVWWLGATLQHKATQRLERLREL